LLFASCGFLFFAVLCLTVGGSDDGPRYEGKSLKIWLRVYADSYESGHEESGKNAVSAIRAIGTNALPTLLKMVAHEAPKWNYSVLSLSTHGPRRFTDWWEQRLAVYEQQRLLAVYGFGVLSTNAGPAIPELVRLLDHNNFSELMVGPKGALIAIGAPAFPDLLRTAADTRSPEKRRSGALYALAYAGTNFVGDAVYE
jgi:hypothetical protein